MPTPITKLIDALSARTHFGEVMTEVESKNSRFVVSRRGKPKMVLLSVDDYLQNILKKPAILAEIQSRAVFGGLDKMSEIEIEAEISAARVDRKKGKK